LKEIVSFIYRRRGDFSRDFNDVVNLYDKQTNFRKRDSNVMVCGSYQAVLLPTLSVVSFPQTIGRCRR